MSYGMYFALSLLCTLAVEIPILFVLTRYLLKTKIPAKEIFYWGAFVNFFSLPYLWFVLPLFIGSSSYALVGESLVVLIETTIFVTVLKINIKKAFLISLVANLASYAVGVFIL